jgi:hypothetical protein
MTTRPFFAVLLAGVLLAPGCGSGSPTIPDVTRAAIDISVAPNPVVGNQNTLTGAVTAQYTITITEIAGLGGEVQFVSSTVFDPTTGKQVALTYYDGADLIVYVGSKRVEPKGTLVVPQTASYTLTDLSVPANLSISVQIKDDRENLVHASLLVKIDKAQ